MKRKEVVSKAKVIVVKVGSGVLATPREGINRGIVEGIVEDICALRGEGREVVLVTSGAIACGMEALGIEIRPEDIVTKQAVAAIGQPILMDTYKRAFERFGVKVAQILLSKDDLIGDRKRFINTRNTFEALRIFRAVPIVNENDSVAVDEIKFGDNDTLSSYVAGLVGADLLVILSDIDGLYRGDPRSGGGSLIKEVSATDPILDRISRGKSRSFFGTGGILSKVEAVRRASSFGIPVVVANGKRKKVLLDVIEGKDVGTLVLPGKRLKGKKRWIGFYARAKGKIYVDHGAYSAIVQGGKSLLPGGIVKVEGEFDRGDVVFIVDPQGKPFAKGLTNYSSQELEKIKGKKTSELSRILGYKYRDEVIHRDDMVLLEH